MVLMSKTSKQCGYSLVNDYKRLQSGISEGGTYGVRPFLNARYWIESPVGMEVGHGSNPFIP